MSEPTTSLQLVGDKPEVSSKPDAFRSNTIFMICLGSVASVFGFGYTYMQAKRNEIKEITSHSTPKAVREQMIQLRDGTRVASRALAYSWMWSIGGVSLLSYCAWKLSGATSLDDFRHKAGESLPVIPKAEVQGRNNFESLKDLADYLEEEDSKKENTQSKTNISSS